MTAWDYVLLFLSCVTAVAIGWTAMNAQQVNPNPNPDLDPNPSSHRGRLGWTAMNAQQVNPNPNPNPSRCWSSPNLNLNPNPSST